MFVQYTITGVKTLIDVNMVKQWLDLGNFSLSIPITVTISPICTQNLNLIFQVSALGCS